MIRVNENRDLIVGHRRPRGEAKLQPRSEPEPLKQEGLPDVETAVFRLNPSTAVLCKKQDGKFFTILFELNGVWVAARKYSHFKGAGIKCWLDRESGPGDYLYITKHIDEKTVSATVVPRDQI